MQRFLKLFISIFIVIHSSIGFSAEIPIGRKTISLSGSWKFKTDENNIGTTNGWYKKDYKDINWDNIDVPGNWDTKEKYANYKGKAWYRKSIFIPLIPNKTYTISFESVGISYSVYINNKKAAQIISGNGRENIEINNFITANSINQISVLADNSLQWGAYWSWGGLRRPVSIFIDEDLRVINQKIQTNVNLIDSSAIITTSVLIKNNSTNRKTFTIDQFIDRKYKANKNIKTVQSIGPNTEKWITLHIPLDSNETELWHFDNPSLYTSKVSIVEKNKTIYSHKTNFGIRKIEITKKNLSLNGETIKLTGYNWVADDRTTGNTLPSYRFKNDIDLMKAAGATLARLSHRPLPEDVMDYLDEKGMMVIAEFNNWPEYMNGQSKEPKEFAKQLIEENYNHPSIIGWSIGNENGYVKDYPEVNNYVSSVIKYIKNTLDSTRFISYASHTADYQDDDAAQYCDLIMINKYGNYNASVRELERRYPDKAIYISEYGSHIHSMIYDTPDKTVFTNLMTDSLFHFPSVIGYSLWTFNDYRSNYQTASPSTSTPPSQNRQWGIVDVYRNRKRAYKQLQDFYAPVSNLTSNFNTDSNTLHIECKLTPRSRNNIPSFTLKNYKLVWEIRNIKNKVILMGYFPLEFIHLGESEKLFKKKIENIKDAYVVKWSLLSPTEYVVSFTENYVSAPPPPQIKDFICANGEARIIIDTNTVAQEHQFCYSINGKEVITKPTIDHFIDLLNIPHNTEVTGYLIALNKYGKSLPSKEIKFKIQNGFAKLPPVIWKTEPSDKGFYIGLGYHYSDNQYEIRYKEIREDSTVWQSKFSNNYGLCEISGLANNKKYQFQVRRFIGYNNAASKWSELNTVIPRYDHSIGNAQIHGFHQNEKTLLISLTPGQNISNIEIQCIFKDKVKNYIINRSDAQLISIELESHDIVIDVLPIIRSK